MRVLTVVTVAVVVHGLLLFHQTVGEKSVGELENALEEALQRLREAKEKEDSKNEETASQAIAVWASNLTTVLEDLAEAIKDNTEEIRKMSMEPEESEDGGEGSTTEHVKCEPPFFSLKSECFYVNKYKRVSWSEARNFCKGLGSDLAEPVRVNSLRAMLLHKFPENAYQFFWVGAMEVATEGNWTWLSSKRLQPSDWATGQPDGGNENCVVLSRDDYPALHDSPCYTNTMFICERIMLHRQ